MYGCGKRSDGVEVFRRLGRGPRWLLIIILISSFYTNSGENGEHCPGVFGRLIQESAQAQVQVPRSRCPGAPWFRKPGQNFFGGIKLAATNYNQKAHLPCAMCLSSQEMYFPICGNGCGVRSRTFGKCTCERRRVFEGGPLIFWQFFCCACDHDCMYNWDKYSESEQIRIMKINEIFRNPKIAEMVTLWQPASCCRNGWNPIQLSMSSHLGRRNWNSIFK